MKPIKTVKIGNQECLVQTLREWINDRLTQLRQANRLRRFNGLCDAFEAENTNGRIVELEIVRDKINDGRIQGID